MEESTTVKNEHAKQSPFQQQIDQTQIAYDAISAGITLQSSRELSEDERLLSHGEINFLISPLLYGEALHWSMAEFFYEVQIFCMTDPDVQEKVGGGIFGIGSGDQEGDRRGVAVDLGAGSGKVALTMALTLPQVLKESNGVELLEGLHEQSLKLKTQYDEYEHKTNPSCDLAFQQYDFMAQMERWVTSDVIFANATAFDKPMMEQISKGWLEKGKAGSVFIITTKEIGDQNNTEEPANMIQTSEKQFAVYGPVMKEMSWGETAVRAFVKLV